MLTVYICLVVIARIVYFPMRLVDGRIASLILDVDKIFPLWINLIPIVHLFDVYDGWLIRHFQLKITDRVLAALRIGHN